MIINKQYLVKSKVKNTFGFKNKYQQYFIILIDLAET